MEQINNFKNGIFGLRTNFGELAQLMIGQRYGLSPSGSKYYDLVGDNGIRVEVKFSRAYEKKKKMTLENAIEICLDGNALQNVVSRDEAEQKQFDCNIQQIKPDEFDVLIYGVFFNDVVEIFQVQSSEIMNMPAVSDRQHKGNVGEGQFHIKKKNIKQHREKFYVESLTYWELYQLLKDK